MLDMDDQKSLSPSKLNKELNKILETERMIKEYKEMITKMQRDLYSKKTTTESVNSQGLKLRVEHDQQSMKSPLSSSSKQALPRKKIY